MTLSGAQSRHLQFTHGSGKMYAVKSRRENAACLGFPTGGVFF
nr:MAG TPA: hypothetical protein [Caudoviricetes sp.]